MLSIDMVQKKETTRRKLGEGQEKGKERGD